MPYSYRSSRQSGRRAAPGRGRSNQRQRSNKNKRNAQYIDPRRFVAAATVSEAEVYEPLHRFEDFVVDAQLHDNLAANGYEIPTPIQDQSIPVALSGHDVIGVASTGTGKTAAFAIPVLHQLLIHDDAAAIIVAPTRELAQQIDAECRKIGKGTGLTGAVLIGGSAMGPQLRDLSVKPKIVIGTPGRIKDHVERGSLDLSTYNIVVLDEVDRMLDMGFVKDIRSIIDLTASNRQCLLFSATIDDGVRRIIDEFTQNPITTAVASVKASQNVHQDVVCYDSPESKMSQLHDLLNQADVSKVIVFDETQRSVERLGQKLAERGFSVDAIHGGKTQGQRQRALKRFKDNDIKILVATDVAARGIDVADVSHVVNYSVPQTYDDYIHRIGRAGRAGKIGYALTFVTER